jgi:hypothetical protein
MRSPIFARPRLGVVTAVLAAAAAAALGAGPSPARADGPATCQAPSGLIAHPGRTRMIYAGCAPAGAVPARVTLDPPSHGRVTALSPLTFAYEADPDHVGPVSFTVHPTGADDQAWPAFMVGLAVSSTENTPPKCGHGSADGATREGRPIALTINACADDEGDPLTLEIVDGPAHGHLGAVAPGPQGGGYTVTYTPDPGFTGTDTIGYAAVDDHGGTSPTATIAVQVASLDHNTPPSCVLTSLFPAQEATDVSHGPTRFFVNCRDLDGDPLTLTFVQPPAHGTAAADPTDPGTTPSFLYTPEPGYFGLDTLVVRIDDGLGGSVLMTRRIAVGSPHWPECRINTDVPVPGRSATTDPGVAVAFPCTDADGDHLTGSVAQPTTHGTVVFDDATGTVTYTPDVGYVGDDDLGLEVDDGRYGGNFGWLHFHVAAPSGTNPVVRAATARTVGATRTAADRAATLLGVGAKPLNLGLGAAARGFATGAARVRHGAPLAVVFCAKACTLTSSGRLTPRHRRAFKLARRVVEVRAGATAVVKLTLSKAQRRRLAQARRGTLALAIEVRTGGRTKTVTRRFVVQG